MHEEWQKKLNNILFPDNEGGIEHVDMSMEDFKKFITDIVITARQEGYDLGREHERCGTHITMD